MDKYICQADFCIFPDKEDLQSSAHPHVITGSSSYYVIYLLPHLKSLKGLSANYSLGAVFSVIACVLSVLFGAISNRFG